MRLAFFIFPYMDNIMLYLPRNYLTKWGIYMAVMPLILYLPIAESQAKVLRH